MRDETTKVPDSAFEGLTKPLSLRMPFLLYRAMREYCYKHDMTLTALTFKAIEKFLKDEAQKPRRSKRASGRH